MSDNYTLIRRLFMETESSFGAGPGTANGSAMIMVPVHGQAALKNQKKQVPTNWQIGKNRPSPMLAGLDAAELSFSIPFRGLASSAGDGVAATSTDDSLGKLLSSALGSATSETGEGDASSGHTSTQIRIDATPTSFGANDLIAYQTGAYAIQWRRIMTVANGAGTNDQLTVHRAWAHNPDGSGVAYGYRWWQNPSTYATTGSLSFCYDQDGRYFKLSGCRPSACTIDATVGQIIMANWTVMCDTYAENTSGFSSLDGDVSDSEFYTGAASPLICASSGFEFNGTEYGARSIKIDMGLQTVLLAKSTETNGTGNIVCLRAEPVITVEPLYDYAFDTAFRAATQGSFSCWFGAGTGSPVNSFCFDSPIAQVTTYDVADDSGHMRQTLQIKPCEAGSASSVAYRLFTLARA